GFERQVLDRAAAAVGADGAVGAAVDDRRGLAVGRGEVVAEKPLAASYEDREVEVVGAAVDVDGAAGARLTDDMAEGETWAAERGDIGALGDAVRARRHEVADGRR